MASAADVGQKRPRVETTGQELSAACEARAAELARLYAPHKAATVDVAPARKAVLRAAFRALLPIAVAVGVGFDGKAVTDKDTVTKEVHDRALLTHKKGGPPGICFHAYAALTLPIALLAARATLATPPAELDFILVAKTRFSSYNPKLVDRLLTVVFCELAYEPEDLRGFDPYVEPEPRKRPKAAPAAPRKRPKAAPAAPAPPAATDNLTIMQVCLAESQLHMANAASAVAAKQAAEAATAKAEAARVAEGVRAAALEAKVARLQAAAAERDEGEPARVAALRERVEAALRATEALLNEQT